MNDMIYRQDAIDSLGDEPEVWTGKDEYAQGLNNQWHYDRNAILSCPSAQPDWIPCNDRLPKFGKTVLITNDKGNVSYGRFRGVEFWKEDGDYYWTWKKNTIEHVLAWMPLPEPYTERRQDE